METKVVINKYVSFTDDFEDNVKTVRGMKGNLAYVREVSEDGKYTYINQNSIDFDDVCEVECGALQVNKMYTLKKQIKGSHKYQNQYVLHFIPTKIDGDVMEHLIFPTENKMIKYSKTQGIA